MADLPAPERVLREAAERLGFEWLGIAPAGPPPTYSAFTDWLAAGYHGEMAYLARRIAAYGDPAAILPGVRSLVLLALNYHTAGTPSVATEGTGRVARYAWSGRDYHDLIRARLKRLADALRQHFPAIRSRGVVDTAPLLERDVARQAGLGWFGKNTMLLNKRLGSWFFLAALLVDCELPAAVPHTASHCGTCTRCLDVCPTQAFVAPLVLDARRCISYLTIELRGPIPADLRPGLGDWLFGCDLCQEVCPWNRRAPCTSDPELQPEPGLPRLPLAELFALDEAAFAARFGHTPLARPGRAGLLRNAALVLGNQGDPAAIPALRQGLLDPAALVRGAAAWALGQIGGAAARAALEARLPVETDADVGAELRQALQRWESAGPGSAE